MSTHFKGFALFAILVSAVGAVSAFALPPELLQNSTAANSTLGTSGTPSPQISVTTDKTSYNDGDNITISGSTRDYLADTPLTVIVRNPIGNVIKVDQIQLGTDKTFSDSLTATGGLWQAAGTYTVYVQYGSPDRSAKVTFDFTGSKAAPQGPSMIPVNGTDFSVLYTITNGKVLNIKANTQSKSLVVSIQTTGNGVLTITLPRGLIDAKKPDGTDDKFFVLNDGQEAQFNETGTTSTDRTLIIPFKDGTQQIEIIGTFVIPEFGSIVALVLAIAIISIIALSAKTGLRFTPRC